MKKRIIQAVLLLALVGVAFALRTRDRRYGTPEATISAFFAAAAEGDDRLYLRLTGGELKRELTQLRKQQGVTAFREELRRSVSGVKGRAMTRGGSAPNGFVTMDVEHVFVDRNEQQRFLLSQTAGGWLLESIGQADVNRPLIPYGTSVMSPVPSGKAKSADQSSSSVPLP